MKRIVMVAALAIASVTAFAQQKFAHVNFTELIQLMPEADEARATIEASSKEAQETFNSMLEEYNAKYKTYEQKASAWTPAVRETKEKELVEIERRIQEFRQSIDQELQQQQTNLMSPIYQKANETVKSLAKAGGYIYVIDVNTALYIDPEQSVDLTPEARKVLGIAEGRTLESLSQEIQAKQAAAQAE